MINKIILFSIKHKFAVCLFLLAIVVGGLYSLRTIAVDSTPDITDNQVQVITSSPNLSTTDIEQFVTYPVELAMANLPGVKDVRSISRFGLSVVTVVFKDNMGTYRPRQLVQEKLEALQDEIPEGMGKPAIGPITTGLGEIFQYTLVPDDSAAYSPMELRSIQDWIVKRQLAMIPGVVDVNSFGGSIKQYEVALDPDRLMSMKVSMAEVFNALKENNVNTGGAYIERSHKAHFIRGEGLIKSEDDIRNIVIRNENGMPVLFGDVADHIGFGSQVRYGAFTQDGHEAVGGMILMLKGENSNKVIKNVKARIAEVQKTLPQGIKIKPFLDRSELIQRTTGTISRNLIEGALIVILVLVLLLGSLRGGLISASVIPLSLLFAFILMRIFGVWVNLMSLGAIDFGIIVDGAVIIVEGTVFAVSRKVQKVQTITGKEMDELSYHNASTMMHSAFFGQLIILIIFAPILCLTGVSGKMFQPMAFTFSFALLGAILLCLTYVPMVSAVFLRPMRNGTGAFARFEKRLAAFSDRIMENIHKCYRPVLTYSLNHRKTMIGAALGLLLLTGFVFSRMGSEFIPTLDEGDIAMQTFLRPGSSLTETIKREEEVERVLLASFPEIKTVCARIGVADIPTDPMGFDYTDSFIILEKDRSKWTSARNKEELIEKIQERLSALPGLNFSFSQPVALRFNELLTGVREDVAVKLYGDDLDKLNELSEKMTEIISKIDGAEDVAPERTAGLPQMTVKYDRRKLAEYGLSIKKLDQYISAAFAGSAAGVIFEGEKRFDLVVRLSDRFRKSIDDLRQFPIDLPDGNQVPLAELADIEYHPGPMQISRDGTSRRIYVGVNARGRDVSSLVTEIKEKLDAQLQLPPGYRIVYGGSFENLQEAKARMFIVVPIALLLIFILLFLALGSLRQAAMIYVAVPLAVIGGVLSLYFRGMPFSISAGVGFIVLFGVAVLNGLVLINKFNSLKAEGMADVLERIKVGTSERLRPILLTALSAMFGFLPMAVSDSAGAEVQRPLATVVIGGLVSATLLTLLIVPILYYMEEKNLKKKSQRKALPSAVLLLFLLGFGTAQAQSPVSLGEALRKADVNYPALKASRLQIEDQQILKRTVWDIGETELSTGGEELGRNNDGVKTIVSIRQNLDILGSGARRKLLEQRTDLAEAQFSLTQLQLHRAVSLAYGNAFVAKHRLQMFRRLDSIYSDFEKAAKLRFETEETSQLEFFSAQNQKRRIQIQMEEAERDYTVALQGLSRFLATDTLFTVDESLAGVPQLSAPRSNGIMALDLHPSLQLADRQIKLAQAQQKVTKADFLPKFFVGYGSQKIGSRSGYYSWEAGMSLPLFSWGAESARNRSAAKKTEIARANFDQQRLDFLSEQKVLQIQTDKWLRSLDYYRRSALLLAQEQQKMAVISYREEAIDYLAFIQNLHQTVLTESDYWNAFANYLENRFNLEYFNSANPTK